MSLILVAVIVGLFQWRKNIEYSDLSRIGPDASRRFEIQQEANRESKTNQAKFDKWLNGLDGH